MSVKFRSKSAFSCSGAIGKLNAGSGTLKWTAPAGLGTSDASIQFVIATSTGHTTTASFHGVVTSRANLFTDYRVNGTIKLRQGLKPASAGGDCDGAARLQKFDVSAITMTVS